MVDDILAKSNPFQSLKEHTEEVLKNYNLLKSLSLELGIKLELNKWEILKLACFYHDFGKANSSFQNAIRQNKNLFIIPHNFLSIAFVEEEEEELLQLIAFHHWRDFNFNEQDISKIYKDMQCYIENLSKDFGRNFNLIKEGVFKKRLNDLKRFYSNRIDGIIDVKKDADFIILLGFLNRIDHATSAGIEIEVSPISKFEITRDFLSRKTAQPWQIELFRNEYKDKNGIVMASTGMGKTEMALLWADNKKTFYTLPVRTSVDFMYKRLRKLYGNNKIGLLHSNVLGSLFMEDDKAITDDVFYYYSMAKNLSYNLIVCTPDQLFSATLKYLGFEKIYSTLSYSKIIIDEIQAYSPHMLAITIYGLNEITSLGGKYIIVTATLPEFIKDKIAQDFLVEQIPNLKKHRIKLVEESLGDNEFKKILSNLKNKENKILIICNTVRKAQDLYFSLKEFSPVLLHSRFTRVDRNKKEGEILREDFTGILIATQVVEVSLDIDFDVLLTELAPIDVLIQRMGRVYRRFKTNGDFYPSYPNVYIFTREISGLGGVYENEIVTNTISFLKNGILSEKEKIEMVRQFYTEENLRSTHYFNKFENALASIKYYSVNKKSIAQEIFREISQIEVIPLVLLNNKVSDEKKQILKEFCVEEDSFIKILEKVKIGNKSEQSRKSKILLMELIRDFLVPVPFPLYKNVKIDHLSNYIKNPCLNEFLSEVKVIDCQYNTELGVQFQTTDNKSIENII